MLHCLGPSVNETRVLTGMKIENCREKIFSLQTFFKTRWCRQIESTKLIFIMKFSVLDFFKSASRMPKIAQILVSTFNILGGGGGGCPQTP